jgi:hypothetical protein
MGKASIEDYPICDICDLPIPTAYGVSEKRTFCHDFPDNYDNRGKCSWLRPHEKAYMRGRYECQHPDRDKTAINPVCPLACSCDRDAPTGVPGMRKLMRTFKRRIGELENYILDLELQIDEMKTWNETVDSVDLEIKRGY